jgi:hypothetical protein
VAASTHEEDPRVINVGNLSQKYDWATDQNRVQSARSVRYLDRRHPERYHTSEVIAKLLNFGSMKIGRLAGRAQQTQSCRAERNKPCYQRMFAPPSEVANRF